MIFALIGAGRWGQNYLRVVKSLPDVIIKYVCSGDVSLRSISSDYVKVNDYRKLIEKKDLDGVIIATPATKHFEIAKFFLEVRKPVLLEKPMTVSLREAKKLKVIFEKSNRKLMVGNIFLYNEAFKKFVMLFRKMIRISYIHFEGCDFGPVRDDVSVIWDWAPHDVSMCIELLGKKPIRVCAWAVNHDMIYARLFFENNISAFIRMGWLSPVKKREILAVGQKESLLFDDVSSKKIIHFDRLLNKTNIDYRISEPLVKELEGFIEMVKKNKTPLSDFNRNFAVIEVIDAMEKSIEKNGSIVKVE